GEVGRYHVAVQLLREAAQLSRDKKTKEAEQKEAEAVRLTGDDGWFQIGLQRVRDSKFPEAVVALSNIKPSYVSYTLCQYQLALAALQAEQDNAPLPPGIKGPYKDLAVEALNRIPELTATADPLTNQFYFRAKLKLGTLLYSARKFDPLEALVQS